MTDALERFLRYVKIDTQSAWTGDNKPPSTVKQFDLARVLVQELNDLGLQDVNLDEQCFVTATLPANIDSPAPVVGFLAHLDTTPDFSGKDVNPRCVKYDGGDIVLNEEKNIVLSPRDFPDLAQYTGQTLVVTDGTTLLGADDKAGIAEIMAALKYLVDHPEIQHGTIRVAFTPDEEIGTGIQHFDVKAFGADFAYTIDGGELGELQYENFNAAGAQLTVHGRAVHTGSSKNKMVNSILIGMELNDMLPVEQRPAYTENYEGFYHLDLFEGSVEQTRMRYIIRDHDRAKFEAKKALMERAVAFINQKYGPGTAELEMHDQYYNMREKLEPVMYILDIARQAMEACGVKPLVVPIRGGTDGAQMTYMGLPTPNIFTGEHNPHGKFEYIPVESMEKAVQVIVKIAELAAKA
ncbi:MAG TPA: peptidase T [Chloroflexi bacterium]|nr:peptidase T [Chloroflexota bacterium]HPO57705.1 peptidase T [Anaerolineaceae bacterium]